MLEHEALNAVEPAQSGQSLPDLSNPVAHLDTLRTETDLDARIEDYLDRIYAPMVGRLPYARRQELRNEMRAHVGQLIAAHEELGSEGEEAVTAALRQFGEPALVAGRWLEHLPAEQSMTAETWSVPTRSGPFGVAAKRLATSVALWVAIGAMFDRNIAGPVPGALYISLGASLPCLTGYFIGRRYASNRPELT